MRQYTVNNWTTKIAKSSYGTADSPTAVVHHTQENTSESTLTQAWDFGRRLCSFSRRWLYPLVQQLWSPSECERNKGTGALCSTSCFRFPEIDVPVTLFDFVQGWSHLDDMFQVFSGAEDPLVRQGRGEQKNQKRRTSVAKHASMTPVPQRSYTTVSLISLALSSIPSSSSSSHAHSTIGRRSRNQHAAIEPNPQCNRRSGTGPDEFPATTLALSPLATCAIAVQGTPDPPTRMHAPGARGAVRSAWCRLRGGRSCKWNIRIRFCEGRVNINIDPSMRTNRYG